MLRVTRVGNAEMYVVDCNDLVPDPSRPLGLHSTVLLGRYSVLYGVCTVTFSFFVGMGRRLGSSESERRKAKGERRTTRAKVFFSHAVLPCIRYCTPYPYPYGVHMSIYMYRYLRARLGRGRQDGWQRSMRARGSASRLLEVTGVYSVVAIPYTVVWSNQ
jgi:hypothetical protein